MLIRNATDDQIQQAAKVTENVQLRGFRENNRGRGYKFLLRPIITADRYGRISNSGRKVFAICWHGHRDFFFNLFTLAPDAIIITALSRYDGTDDFEDKYPSTGFNNCGSMVSPLQYRNACHCG